MGTNSALKAKKKPVRKRKDTPAKQRFAPQPALLKGWQQIAAFLSQHVSVAQRWAKDGMPVARQGRYVTAIPDDLNNWLGKESGGEPVQVATAETDLSKELKRGLAFIRQHKNQR